MYRSYLKLFIITSIAGGAVSVEVSCGTAEDTQPLACTCLSATNIEWYQDGNFLSTCASGICLPPSAGVHTFTANATPAYTMSISSFDESYCDKYSCKDTDTSETKAFPDCPEPTTQETTTTTTTTTPTPTTSSTLPTTTTTNAPVTTNDPSATNPVTASSTSGTTTSLPVGDNSNLTAHIIIPAVLGGVFLLIAVTIGVGLCYRYNARIKQDKNTTGMAIEHGSPQHHRSSRPHGSPERHRSHKQHSQHSHTTGHRQDSYLHQGQPIHPEAMGSGYEPHRESNTHYIPYDNPAYTDRM